MGPFAGFCRPGHRSASHPAGTKLPETGGRPVPFGGWGEIIIEVCRGGTRGTYPNLFILQNSYHWQHICFALPCSCTGNNTKAFIQTICNHFVLITVVLNTWTTIAARMKQIRILLSSVGSISMCHRIMEVMPPVWVVIFKIYWDWYIFITVFISEQFF